MKSSSTLLITLILVIPILGSESAFAQRFTSKSQSQQAQSVDNTADQNAAQAYMALKEGNLDDARKYLAKANSSDPFAMYVRAALTPDAAEAADVYKEIVAENEDKPIAREALLQLYKFHFAAGDYNAAHTDYLELSKFPMLTQITDPLGFEDSLQTPAPSVKPQLANTLPAASPTKESGNFAVQVGVFSTPQNARKFMESLRTSGINGAIFTKAESGRTLYAVSAGTFSTRVAAQAFAADLKNRSIDCIVVQR